MIHCKILICFSKLWFSLKFLFKMINLLSFPTSILNSWRIFVLNQPRSLQMGSSGLSATALNKFSPKSTNYNSVIITTTNSLSVLFFLKKCTFSKTYLSTSLQIRTFLTRFFFIRPNWISVSLCMDTSNHLSLPSTKGPYDTPQFLQLNQKISTLKICRFCLNSITLVLPSSLFKSLTFTIANCLSTCLK